MPLDNPIDDDDDPDGYEDCLSLAQAVMTMLTIALDDEPDKVLAVMGAMTEMVLKHCDDRELRERMTTDFVETLSQHMGISRRAAHR